MLLSDIHTLHADTQRDQDAYRCGNARITFGEFDTRVRQLASCLIKHGVRRGARIGIYLGRSIESAIAVHGIMRAGAVWVPLDIFAPPSRTLELIEDCDMYGVITSSPLASKHQDLFKDVRLVIGSNKSDGNRVAWEEVFIENADECPDVGLNPDDPAYIIYTSGTTGKPKGIVHTHASGMAYARLSSQLYEVGRHDVVASHAPLHVDMCTFAYLSAPLAGATTVIFPEAYLKLPASLSGLMEKERISIWYSVPLALSQLLEHGVLHDRDLSSIRWVLYGGEPFQTNVLGKLMEAWPQATFCNVYGPAEVNQCTYYHIREIPPPGTSVPLGHVWKETHARIVDAEGLDVHSNSVGELLIASTTRMKEYWNRPDLTDRAFHDHVDADGAARRYYRTGDLVMRDAEGLLHYMGRKDRQVKIKGFRIELSEIEAILNGIPFIDAGAVVAPRDAAGNRHLVAYITHSDDEPDRADLIAHLGQHLPPHAVPNTFTFLESLPATSAGMLDYATLERKAEQLV